MIATESGLAGMKRLHRPLEIKTPAEQLPPPRKRSAGASWPRPAARFAYGLLLNQR
jgi:hypothetical protein